VQQQREGRHGSSQKLMLFMRGNAMSGAPIISGTNQLPKPPIIAGMTMKKIMIRPCAVTPRLAGFAILVLQPAANRIRTCRCRDRL
jgi:hypothetical protein